MGRGLRLFLTLMFAAGTVQAANVDIPAESDWTDHGVIVHQHDVNWVDPNSYSMWAPDCVYKDGKYYFNVEIDWVRFE